MKIAEKKRGRPVGSGSKLTQEVIESICLYVQNGLNYEDAATMSGVSENLFYKWKKKGETAKSGVYANFLHALSKAAIKGKFFHIQNIQKAAEGVPGHKYEETHEEFDEKGKLVSRKVVKKGAERDTRASMWILERRHPEEFGSQVTVKTDAPITQIIMGSGQVSDQEVTTMNGSIMDPPEDNA